jgi:Bacteriophage tail sheath protein
MSNHLDITNIGKNLSGGIHAPALPPGATLIQITDPQSFPYLPVRRLALYIEQSLTSALQWVVFEPNGPALWSSIANAADDFMNELFRQGRFQGTTPQITYFVKCDATTTTQTDINNGIVNIVVGFAAVKPAEFYILTLRLLAAQPAPPKK